MSLSGKLLYQRFNGSIWPNREKIDFYLRHQLSEEEINKTAFIRQRMLDFEKKVRNNSILQAYSPETGIRYFDGIGYISACIDNNDMVFVYFYGESFIEAFKNVIIDYELKHIIDYEFYNREELYKELNERKKDDSLDEKDYKILLYEKRIKDFNIFYDGNIPDDIIEFFERKLNRGNGITFKYNSDKGLYEKDYSCKTLSITELDEVQPIDYFSGVKGSKLEKKYRKHNFTKNEREKTDEFNARVHEYITVVGGEDLSISDFPSDDTITIYMDYKGYYTSESSKIKDGLIALYYHGIDDERAFLNYIKILEIRRAISCVQKNNDIYEQEYYSLFPEDLDNIANYHVPFAISTLALRSYRKYFGENIPEELINTFENYLNTSTNHTYRYDYESNSIVKNVSKQTKLS